MGRRAKATLRYLMRSNQGGEIKAYLTYNGKRYYSGGNTEIYANSKIFNESFTTSGEFKISNPTNEQLEIRLLLQLLSNEVLAHIESKIKSGVEITLDIFQNAMKIGRNAVLQQKAIWHSNREWNKQIELALKQGDKALEEFYRENPPFSTLFPKSKNSEGGAH